MFQLHDSLGFLINRASRLMRMALEERLAPFGLTAPQWAVLACLMQRGAMQPSELSDVLKLDRPTITGIVTRLAKKTLVKKQPAASDGRSVLICLTDQGRRLIEELPALATEVNAIATRQSNPEELAVLKNEVRKIIRNFEC